MTTKTTVRNVYDPRVRELVRASGNPDLFPGVRLRLDLVTAATHTRLAWTP